MRAALQAALDWSYVVGFNCQKSRLGPHYGEAAEANIILTERMAKPRALEMTAVHTSHIVFAASLIQMSHEAAHINSKGKHGTRGNRFYALCDLVLIFRDEFQLQSLRIREQLDGSAGNGVGTDGDPAPTGRGCIIGRSIILSEHIISLGGHFSDVTCVKQFGSRELITANLCFAGRKG